MSEKPKNTQELLIYLDQLENRIKNLEAQTGGHIIKRAFTIWGYNILANTIIAATIGAAYFCIVFVFIGLILQGGKN